MASTSRRRAGLDRAGSVLTGRCYDPGRMSGATSRRSRRFAAIQALVRGVAWTTLAFVIAVASAGLVAQLWHAPGGPDRAELTYVGDTELSMALEGSEARIRDVAVGVDGLAEEARIALAAVAADDTDVLQQSLSRGTVQASAIDAAVLSLQQTLVSLPGDEPDAALRYRNDVVVRRAALLAAVEAATGLADQWSIVRVRTADVVDLIDLIDLHDTTVLAAAGEGRERRYGLAISILGQARDILVRIEEMRVRLVAGGEATVLDEWIDRNLAYNLALTGLYEALRDDRGRNTPAVQSAIREEMRARERLPADRRAIIVIVSEVARGGLNQAVLAIEETRGRIDTALTAGETNAQSGLDGQPAG
jgi:hypothetical protein